MSGVPLHTIPAQPHRRVVASSCSPKGTLVVVAITIPRAFVPRNAYAVGKGGN